MFANGYGFISVVKNTQVYSKFTSFVDVSVLDGVRGAGELYRNLND